MSDTPRTDKAIPDLAFRPYTLDWQRAQDFARQLELELTEAQHRIRTLIEERDSARIKADHKWRLREEFEALLGTSDVETGVERVKHLKQALLHVVPRCDHLSHSKGDYHMAAEPCRVEELIRKAQKI